MNEEMNNNYESQNNNVSNYEPNNNVQKNYKGKNVLIVILVLIIVLLVALLIYVNFFKKEKVNNKDNKVEEKNYEKINYEVKKEIVGENENGESIETNVLYVNGKKIEESINIAGNIKFHYYANFIIIESFGPGMGSDVFVVDSNGNAVSLVDNSKNQLKYVDLPSSLDDTYAGVKLWNNFSVKDSNNKFIVVVNRQYGNGWVDWYCHLEDKTIISSYSVEYEYLGNGKFNGKIVNEKTIAEEYKNEDCSSVSKEDLVKKDVVTVDNTNEKINMQYLSKLSSEIGSKYNDGGNTQGTSQFFSNGVFGDLSYNISISKNRELKINSNKIADNVLEFFVVPDGNGGAQSLYYIDIKGDLYSVDHELFGDNGIYLATKEELKPKKLSYKNIVSVLPGAYGNARGPIFVDMEGNMYIG